MLNGEANIYVHFRGLKLWDTCAPQAILEAIGGTKLITILSSGQLITSIIGKITLQDGSPIVYKVMENGDYYVKPGILATLFRDPTKHALFLAALNTVPK